jgi:anaerobic magnesium-protoporphyrin IX monomethyl ester cyclase
VASQLDLVLIHPGSRTQIYQSLGSSLSAIEPPVWASLMATFVRKRGFSVCVLDAEGESLRRLLKT